MADAAARLRARAGELAATGPPPGRGWCRAWTAEVDGAIAELHAGLAVPPGPARLCVLATGGYGRAELAPGSDVDLLLLAHGLDDATLEGVVRDLVYPLWDAGLTVGHAVRSPTEAMDQALVDLDTATATVEARWVAGDRELARELRTTLLAKLTRRPDRLLVPLAAADAERRRRHGDAAETLEPHLRDGAGGLRDVQSLRWAAAALLGAADLDALVTAHHLAAADRTRLARAYELLLAVRVALHLEAGRRVDVLGFHLQDAVARRLGHDDADALLQAVFLAARVVDHVHGAAWPTIVADGHRVTARGRVARRLRRPAERTVDERFALADGVLRLEPGTDLDDVSLPVRLGRALADTGAALHRPSAERVARATRERPAPDVWDAADRRTFLDLLWRGHAGLPALFELDDLGLLAHLIPEWTPLRGRPQRNPFHRYSLDRHALHAAAELAELAREEAWARSTLDEIRDRDGLMLATLLHDVGKAVGEPHSETGVPVARAVCERLGVAAGTVELVERLVRLHLLLPEVATRRDLTDPALLIEVAGTVEDAQTLACLHLLAAADGRATGPSAWTSWKATLVAELVTKVRTVLDDDGPGATGDAAADDARVAAEMARVAAETARAAAEAAPGMGVDPDVVVTHLAAMPQRYAAAVPPRSVVRHAGTAAAPAGPSEVRTRVSPGDGVDDLDVIARDHPGLFSKVAGVLALHGGSVLSAHAFTRADGLAVDTFKVRVGDGTPDRPGAWWAAVEGDLVDAVAGRLALRARIDRKLTSRRRPTAPRPPVGTRVDLHPDASGRTTVVEVHTQDQLGVLYRIAAALAEMELDIVAARIDTVGDEAVDVFYVRDASGAPLDDEHAGEVVLGVTAALAP